MSNQLPTITIDQVHSHVHAGRYFSASYHDSAVSNNENVDVLLVTGSWSPHIKASAQVTGLCVAYMYEGTTASNNGTVVSYMNHNRNSTKTPTMSIYHTPTVTGVGTQLDGTTLLIGSTTNNNSQTTIGSTGSSFESEVVLKPNTKYLIRVTSNAGAFSSIQVVIRLDFYEPHLD